MRVYIKNRTRLKSEFQFFMHDFVDVCKNNGFKSKLDFFPSYKYHIRSLLKRFLLSFFKIFHISSKHKSEALIITSNGLTIAETLFPYYFRYEPIPMLWDVWPSTWLQMQRDFYRFNIRTVLITVRTVADMINTEMPDVKALWVPEGIEVSHYHKGEPLINRQFDVLELGRQMKEYHLVLSAMNEKNMLNGWTTSHVSSEGTLVKNKLTFSNNDILYNELPKYKVMICFPQCDTNPFRAGHIETLTQRYWEAMLSGCLMIGRAPQELIDLIGYDPVLNIDWNNPEQQLKDILDNIIQYQDLVDKNYESAINYAPWEKRIDSIKEFLLNNGYDI